jgi:3-oxoacyl-[acyl-carrier protein] reductase
MLNEPKTKVALVFGATGGIGSELSRQLAREGWTLTLAGRNSERLSALSDELQSFRLVADATNPDEVDRCVTETVARHGRLDAVAHCVGSLLLKPAHTTTDADWHHTLRTNLTSAFYVLRAASQAMRAEGGAIVLVSSSAAQRGLPNHEAIAAAKAGLIGLALSAAATYARHSIRVNCIAPGLVRTPLTEPITRLKSALQYSTSLHALKRIGEPADVASAIRWLMQPEQNWITGQVLGVDGGLANIQPTPTH